MLFFLCVLASSISTLDQIANLTLIEEAASMTPTKLAWCSRIHDKIRVVDLETKQKDTEFEGVQIKEIILF